MSASPSALSGKAFTVWLDPACWPVPALKLPGAAFSVWLDPSTWPASPLKLPSEGGTVWLEPTRWPKAKLQLPASAAFIHWLSPSTWPKALLKLPSGAFTHWLNPETWPQDLATPEPPAAETLAAEAVSLEALPEPEVVSTPVPEPLPLVTPTASPVPVFPVDKPILRAAKNRAFTVWVQKAAEAVSPGATPPIKLPGKAFTLWAKSTVAVPIPMRNGMTAAELERSTHQAAASAATRPHAGAVTASGSAQQGGNRWLPLAAAIALVGLAGLKMSTDDSRLAAVENEAATLRTQLGNAGQNVQAMAQEKSAASQALATKTAELEAKLKEAAELSAKTAADLAAAKTAADNAAKAAAEKAAALAKANADLDAAKKEATGKDSDTQAQILAAAEETAKTKRTSAAEIVTLRETLGKLEAEKAAALKDAAQAAQEKAFLQTALDALKKPGA